MTVTSMRQLLEAGVHFGHQTRRWNPKMKRYLLGERNDIYIIDLQQSIALLEQAYNAVRDTVVKGGTVLFVGTKRQAAEVIEQQAQRVGMPYITHRWLGGMLTNFATIKGRLARLEELERMEADGTMELLPKKEVLSLQREKDKLMANLGGIRQMSAPPDMLWVVDTVKEHIAVDEANRLGIPVAAILDSNCDPDVVDYPVPGNDDANRSVALLTRLIADACAEGHATLASRSTDEVAAEQAAAAAGTSAGGPEAGPEVEPLAEWEIALQREEAAQKAEQASYPGEEEGLAASPAEEDAGLAWTGGGESAEEEPSERDESQSG